MLKSVATVCVACLPLVSAGQGKLYKCESESGAVSFQQQPCKRSEAATELEAKHVPTTRMGDNILERSGSARSMTGSPGITIRTKCASEWPQDFNMRAYCEKRQVEALAVLQRPIQASPGDAEVIRSKCAGDWPEDFVMRAYCENRQVEGLRALGR